MGLDNGIRVKNVTRKQLPKLMRFPFSEDYSDGIEVAYWRKCYGLRGEILDMLKNEITDYYEYPLSREDVSNIWRLVVYYLRHPNEWGDSIWEYDEIEDDLRQQSFNLMLLWHWMKKHPEAKVYFYDSY